MEKSVLVVGELYVDYTHSQGGGGSKLRLGGVAHAARGLWAAGIDYSVAAVCPSYLVDQARSFLLEYACKEFIWLAEVKGSPNVVLIGDPQEVGHQGYEDLMRDSKCVSMNPVDLSAYERVVVFPGKFDLHLVAEMLSESSNVSLDIAYDVRDLGDLSVLRGRIGLLAISTSSPLFMDVGSEDVDKLLSKLFELDPEAVLLKENRGGSRLFDGSGVIGEEIPAVLGRTVNSVGVGDVYTAVMVGHQSHGWSCAAWRGAQAATEYSGSTFPDDIRVGVQRQLSLDVSVVQGLGGVSLPWHDRRRYAIYLAAPDFSYLNNPEIGLAIQSMEYHNFSVRRPIVENGELTRPAGEFELIHAYHKDCELLKECDVIFAIPIDRDPGTLVEVGMGIELGKPVIIYDPRGENENTMVVAGSYSYSSSLDVSLNALYSALSMLRRKP
ncbi:nucleoside 2-deoxyribosyltransferase [Stenotrophomonas sp. GD03930]|uniref:nucleoside 2-deoxyribosyltransferase n=2 Tax=Stenotrophomonas TaxID=40323 RepID=UPI002448D00C|nr:nucleoside 2-deoxyribosyltransferase [Stenotrophomonas sp. GD03930]MDH1232402.1 nucleoside 2-deoxyribosyltransferase [Stenotrophomonas sp. GD03930]